MRIEEKINYQTWPALTSKKSTSHKKKNTKCKELSEKNISNCPAWEVRQWKLFETQLVPGVQIVWKGVKNVEQAKHNIVLWYLNNGYPPSPSKWVSPGNLLAALFHSTELRRTRESCTEPGQLARTSVNTILSSHTSWKQS